ncbi:helix-turn-helix transcriptional regulator [Paenibacillus sp. GbtcB18]|uniref:ArsR/SmtB family transcription factor n=1 Tax=Paenibacillus sp. GbtcB18 TaxID=2824763 RepID=UPI0020C6E3FF|nr:winged helix-turn-helix domain-containing protein [Paenibacillus sp. GbtcB18]
MPYRQPDSYSLGSKGSVNGMAYEVEFSFQPANELIVSLHTYLCKIWYKRIGLGPDWAPEIRTGLTDDFRQELDSTELSPEWRLIFLFAYLSPEKKDVPGFLRWLESLSLGDLYVLLSPYIQNFPADMQAVRDKFVHLLSEWNSQYFAKVEPGIVAALDEDAEKNRALIGRMPAAELAEQTTSGMYFEPGGSLAKVVLTPQFHFVPGNVFYSFGPVTLCQYPASLPGHDHEEGPSPKLYRMLRSLSEKSRLRILRFLRSEPHSFIEVVRYLGISKGITHEHLFSLRCAGLLKAHVTGETVTGYSLRTSAVGELQELLLAYLED